MLNQEATEQFTASLSPNEADLQPGQGQTFSLTLTNTGTDAESLNCSVRDLPTGATVQLGQSNVSLAPGSRTTVRSHSAQTIQSSTVFNLEVTAAASVVSQVGLCRGVHPARRSPTS